MAARRALGSSSAGLLLVWLLLPGQLFAQPAEGDLPAASAGAEAPAEPPAEPETGPADPEPAPAEPPAEPAPAEPAPAEPEPAEPSPAEPEAAEPEAAAAETTDEEDGWGEGDDAGWGDEGDDAGFGALPPVPDAAPPPPPRSWSLGGFARYDLGLWSRGGLPDLALAPDHPARRSAFAKQRASLDLAFRWSDGPWRARAEVHGEYDLAYLSDRERFDEPTLETYEARIIGGETWLAVTLGDVDLTVGRQIVVWGEGDVLSPLDVVSPRDLREPGLADLDDLRLAVLGLRAAWFVGDHRLELLAVPEAYFGERPPPLGVFSPLRAVVLRDPLARSVLGPKTVRYRSLQERFDPTQTGAFARWVYKGPGLDLGLYAASPLDHQGAVRLPPPASFTDDPITIELDHRRYWLLGHSGATPLGAWLLKWELVGTLDKLYNTGDPAAELNAADLINDPDALLGVASASLISGMFGLTYAGIPDTTLGLEAQAGVFVDGPDDILFPADVPTLSVRATHLAMRQTLTLLGTATVFGLTAERGWLVRVEAAHDFADGFSASVGYVHFGAGDDDAFGPFYGLEQNDRVYGRLRWDFQL